MIHQYVSNGYHIVLDVNSGSINGTYDIGCELQRKRVECAIMIKAALADEEKEKAL